MIIINMTGQMMLTSSTTVFSIYGPVSLEPAAKRKETNTTIDTINKMTTRLFDVLDKNRQLVGRRAIMEIGNAIRPDRAKAVSRSSRLCAVSDAILSSVVETNFVFLRSFNSQIVNRTGALGFGGPKRPGSKLIRVMST
jgi:hypothetical protein